MAHDVVWFDIPSSDLDRAVRFYKQVLNIEIQREEEPRMGVFRHADDDVSGCIYETPEAEPSNCGILLYFNCNDRLEEAVSQVEELGGEIIRPIHEIGPFGRRAIVLDSEGNRICLHSES